jgi:hypothetical protein
VHQAALPDGARQALLGSLSEIGSSVISKIPARLVRPWRGQGPEQRPLKAPGNHPLSRHPRSLVLRSELPPRPAMEDPLPRPTILGLPSKWKLWVTSFSGSLSIAAQAR